MRIQSSILSCLLFCANLYSSPTLGKEAVTLEGKLAVAAGKEPRLESGTKNISLSITDEAISETLQDARNSGKQLKAMGEFCKDGSFEVSDFWVIHPDGLYKIIYYCNVCHITAFSPGNCICCQQPTAPQEVPLTDPRVRHEDVKSPPK